MMIDCVAMSAFTDFCFIVAILFSSNDASALDSILHSSFDFLMKIFYISTESRAVATALLAFLFACVIWYFFFAQCGFFNVQIALRPHRHNDDKSRMIFAFARNRDLPTSHVFERVHKGSGMPLNALCLSAIMTNLFGCIFLISTTAFFVISSASMMTLNISYTLPIVIHCAQGRNKLAPRAFALPSALG